MARTVRTLMLPQYSRLLYQTVFSFGNIETYMSKATAEIRI